MKWIAAVMILSGAIGFGYSIMQEDRDKLSLLMQQEKLLCLLQGEITHFHRKLADAFEDVGDKIGEPYSYFLKKVSAHMQEWNGEPLEDIWRKELAIVERKYHINAALHTGLYKLIENTDYEEIEMQTRVFEYVREDIEREIEVKRKKLEQNQRWIMGFCTLTGILCVIVLI